MIYFLNQSENIKSRHTPSKLVSTAPTKMTEKDSGQVIVPD